jgi:plastocyanin
MKQFEPEVFAIAKIGTVNPTLALVEGAPADNRLGGWVKKARTTYPHKVLSTRLLRCAAISWALGCSQLAAAVANVNIIDYAFSPVTTTINVNDQVKWTWLGYYHTTTSATPGLWDSGLYNTGHTYTHTFTTAGTFPYSCTYHSFTGSVVVQAAPDAPPSVSITNPATGTVLSAPASLTLKANASDSDGSVTNVQFFQFTTSLGSVQQTPYSIAVTGLSVGNYTFSAVATDNGGFKATNAIVVKVIAPSANTLGSIRRVSPTSFQFTYAADVGLRYQVEQSSDLRNWSSLGANTATSSQVLFQDTNALGNARFYRVGRLPNP